MSIFDGNMPYTNLHELNLDWIIKQVKTLKVQIGNLNPEEVQEKLDEFQEDITVIQEDVSRLNSYITPVENTSELATEFDNKLRKINNTCIFNALSSDGWTDMPENETDGCVINLIYYDKEVEYPLVPEGNHLVRDYNLLQLFADSSLFCYRIVQRRNEVATTSAWNNLTETVI